MTKEITSKRIRKELSRRYDADLFTNKDLGGALEASDEFRRVAGILEKNGIPVREIHQDIDVPNPMLSSANFPYSSIYVEADPTTLYTISRIKELKNFGFSYYENPDNGDTYVSNYVFGADIHPLITITPKTPPATGWKERARIKLEEVLSLGTVSIGKPPVRIK